MKDSERIAYLLAALLSVAIVAFAYGAEKYSKLGPYTDLTVVKQRYNRCKEQAPEGMDCVMVPMMVSNDVAKKVGQSK